jgi:hypothetical protein
MDFKVYDMEEAQLSPDRRGRLFALRSKHITLLFLLGATQRSSGCSLINDRRADLLYHVRSDGDGSNWLS